MTDIAELARRLTKAQREAIVTGQGSVGVCRALREKGIAERVEGTGMNWSAFPIFSSLGHALRAYLLQQKEAQ